MTKATNNREATLRLTRPLRRDVDALKARVVALEKQHRALLRALTPAKARPSTRPYDVLRHPRTRG